MKIKAIVATTKLVDTRRGPERFAPEALAKLADSAKGKPILRNFDRTKLLGIVTRAWIENGQLCIEGEINIDALAQARIVPSYGVITTYDAESIAYELTTSPCEINLPEIEEANDG